MAERFDVTCFYGRRKACPCCNQIARLAPIVDRNQTMVILLTEARDALQSAGGYDPLVERIDAFMAMPQSGTGTEES